jgi:hypothetical protein
MPEMSDDDYPTPTNGKPFYCTKCDMGFGEYMACELPDCKLESEEEAQARSVEARGWRQSAVGTWYHPDKPFEDALKEPPGIS